MMKSSLAAALVFCTIGGAASLAQAPTSPNAPEASPATKTAQGADVESCGGAVAGAKDNIFLRLQGFNGEANRGTAQVHLHMAEQAAATGDAAGCWKELNLSRQYVR